MSSESSWFYEGFALIAASQFEKTAPLLNATEIWDIVSAQERGDYRQYAAAFRYFLGKTSIQQLIEMADKPEFFGGQGNQASVVFDETGGRGAPLVAPDAINRALRSLGVSSLGLADEFEVVGLGRHRNTDAWLGDGG